MPCYKNGKLLMMAACYKSGKLMMTSLIIMKIKFICFEKDKVGKSRIRSYARLHTKLYNRFFDHGVKFDNTASQI